MAMTRFRLHARPARLPCDGSAYEDYWNGLEGSVAFDYATYLKDDILAKVDRTSMSVGLESREPLVFHRLINFVARLPFELKFERDTSKRILKVLVHRYVPEAIMQRPKAGFSLRSYSWLRGELAGLLDEFCLPVAFRETGLLNEKFLSRQAEPFRKGRLHYSPLIWRLLMIQTWGQKWLRIW